MTGTFLAAWIKLRRPTLLGGTAAAIAALTALITALVFVNAEAAPVAVESDGPQAPFEGITLAALAQEGGLLQGLSVSTNLLGVIALCVAAATFAGEYGTGTLRNLLIRQPGRLRVLGGTWAAVTSFAVLGVAVAAVVSGLTAVALAGSQGVDTAAWFTADGWQTSARTLGQVALAGLGYATLGSALGILMRASVPAVAIGLAWLLPIETILTGTVEGADRWLPGQLLAAVASNGTATVTLTAALATVGAYLLVSVVAAGTSFVRRDVTA